jgi:hypothetical protein
MNEKEKGKEKKTGTPGTVEYNRRLFVSLNTMLKDNIQTCNKTEKTKQTKKNIIG